MRDARTRRLLVLGIPMAAAFVAAGCPFQTGGLPSGQTGFGGSAAASTTAPAATSSAGGPKLCKPGTTRPCYDADAGAPEAGACAAGTQSCNAEGTAYDAECVGEVVPMPNNCASMMNLHCDVPAPVCTGTPSQVLVVGAQDDDRGLGVAVDAMGNAFVTGLFHDTVDFGGTKLTAVDFGSDAFVAKYDATGSLQWAQQLGGGGDDQGTAVALDADGYVYVTGWFSQSITVAGVPTSGKGIYVAKLNGGDGSAVWGHAYVGDYNTHAPTAIAVGNTGQVSVVGVNSGNLTVSPSWMLTGTGADDDGFVLSLSPNGVPLWLRQVTDSSFGLQALYGVAVDPTDGSVVVAGTAQGDVDFGDHQLVTMHGNYQNVAIARYDAVQGQPVWKYLIGEDNDTQTGYGVAVDAKGDVYLTGDFQTQIAFGTTTLSAATAGSVAMFVARLHPDGSTGWAYAFPATIQSAGLGIAVDPFSVAVGGFFQGTLTGGGASLTALGTQDALVLKLTTAGSLLWARQLGGPADTAFAHAVAFDPRVQNPLGRVAATGAWSIQLDDVLGADAGADAGFGPFTSAGSNDVFLARFDP